MQALLYRYFPTKSDLIERVFTEIYARRWKPEWKVLLESTAGAVDDRLIRFYHDYYRTVLTYEWTRIFFFSGLLHSGIHKRSLEVIRRQIFLPIVGQMRGSLNLPTLEQQSATDRELELVWNLHASVFYCAIRRWILDMPSPLGEEATIELAVRTLWMERGRISAKSMVADPSNCA